MGDPTEESIASAFPLLDSMRWEWLPFALLFVAVHFVAEPVRWSILFPQSAPLRVWLSLFNFSALLSYLMPFKLGIPIRLLFLHVKAGLSPAQISAGMVADASCYYGVWAVCGLSGFLVLAQRLTALQNNPQIWAVLIAVGCLGLVLLVKKMLGKLAPSFMKSGAQSALLVFRLRKFAIIGGVVLLDVLFQLLRHLALVRLFDSNLPMGDIFALAASAILAGLLSFTPMGLGGYDAVLIAGLTEYGMSLKTATLVAVSNRLCSLLIAVVLGAFGAFVLKVYPRDLRALRRMVKKSDSAEGREYPPDSFSSN